MAAKQFRRNVTKTLVSEVRVSTNRIKAALIKAAIRARPGSTYWRKAIGNATFCQISSHSTLNGERNRCRIKAFLFLNLNPKHALPACACTPREPTLSLDRTLIKRI
jgi:hypothetical protein